MNSEFPISFWLQIYQYHGYHDSKDISDKNEIIRDSKEIRDINPKEGGGPNGPQHI